MGLAQKIREAQEGGDGEGRRLITEGKKKARSEYSEYLQAVENAYRREKGESLPENLEAVLGQSLENTEQWVAEKLQQKGVVATEALQSSDLGTFIRHGFELISAIIPTSILNDIVSVQPMDREQGKAFFLDYEYDSDKGNVTQGTRVFDAKSGSNVDPTYAMEEINAEPAGSSGSTNYTGTVRYTPIVSGTFTIKEVQSDGTVTQTASDDGSGNLTGDVAGGGTNSIDYSTGSYDVTFSSSTSDNVVVDYTTNFEASPANIPRLKFAIREENLEASDRKLIVNWLLDASFRMEQYFGRDVEEILVGLLAGVIRAEQDQYVLDQLLNAAQASNEGSFDATVNIQHSQNERNEDFINTVLADKGQIEDQTGHMTASWMAAGSDVITLLRGLEDFNMTSRSNEDMVGPHKIGEIYDLNIYKVRAFSNDEYVMGAKGNNFLQAAAVWAPFIPIMITDPYFTQNMEQERGIMTSSAWRVLNNGGYVRNSVTT